MEELFLDAQIREEVGRGKVKGLKDKGYVPAVIYSEGKDAMSLKLSHRQLVQLVHQHRIEGVVININIKDDKKQKSRPCIIKEIQHGPVHGEILHVDFNQISLTQKIKVNIPIVTKGEPAGVKLEGGSLEHILWEIEVECLPTNIPKDIEIDISSLKLGDTVHIKDIPAPFGTKILTDSEAIILSISEPMKEEVPVEAAEEEGLKEPEVIKEKKETPAEGEAKEEEKKEAKEK
ncbi:MAG: 50S ribosomal protein L25 [Candidatus Omnitrophica bacterium]|nr:50S ribosomal protein L25 [Candidatus Omnitrophota bacterium]